MNVFDYLTVDNTQSCRTILESALVIPETGSKLEPISPLDAVKYAPGLPGCLLLNLNGTTPLRFRLIGRCKFVIRAYDRITPDGNKLGLYWIGYRKEGDPLLNYELEFDKVLYDERRDRLGDIYRLDQKFGTTLNPTQYWYKMYYERTATPTPFNLKSHIDYGVFDSAMYEVGPEIRLLLEAQQYPYTGSPPLPVRQRLLVVHVDSDVSWVDCDEGSDDNPGTYGEPFRTITHALSIAGYNDHIFVKPGRCEASDGEAFPLQVPDGVRLEGSGYFGIDAGGTVIDGYVTPLQNTFSLENCGRNTIIEGFAINAGETGIWLDGASPVIRHNRIIANSSAGIWCVNSSSPKIQNNLIVTNGGDGIYVQGMTQGDLPVEIYGNTLNGNSADGIYSADFSYIYVLDNIITGNGEWGIYAELSSTQILAFNNIFDNLSGSTNFSPYPGTGMLYADPEYDAGSYGSYYLNHTGRGLSPCVDAGSTSPEDYGVSGRTTDPNGQLDIDRVDIGFHHQAIAPSTTPSATPVASETPSPCPSDTPEASPTLTPYHSPTPTQTPHTAGTLQESFEGTLDGWYFEGLWHVASDDPEDEYYSSYAQVSDGTRALWYGQNSNGTYNTGDTNSGILISPTILLTEPFSLVFDSWEQTEGAGYGLDTRKIYASLDDGESWQLLHASNRNNAGYQEIVVDLTQFQGLVLRFKLEFDSVDDRFNNFRGWFIDNLRIEIYQPVPSLNTWGTIMLIILVGFILVRAQKKG